MKTFTLYRTAAETFRVLVDGGVHPQLVGFADADKAIDKCSSLFPEAVVDVPTDLRHYVKGIYTLIRSLEGFYYLRNAEGVTYQATKSTDPIGAIKYFQPNEVKYIIPQEVAILLKPADVLFFSKDYTTGKRANDDQFFQGGYILGGMFRETKQDFDTIQAHLDQIAGVSEFLQAVTAYESTGCTVTPLVLDDLASTQFTHIDGFLVWPLTVA